MILSTPSGARVLPVVGVLHFQIFANKTEAATFPQVPDDESQPLQPNVVAQGLQATEERGRHHGLGCGQHASGHGRGALGQRFPGLRLRQEDDRGSLPSPTE